MAHTHGDEFAVLQSNAPSMGLVGLIRRCSVARRLHRRAVVAKFLPVWSL